MFGIGFYVYSRDWKLQNLKEFNDCQLKSDEMRRISHFFLITMYYEMNKLWFAATYIH